MIHYSDTVSIKITKEAQKFYLERTGQHFNIGTTICVDRKLTPDLVYKPKIK